jgi:hypothetical protein
MGDWETLCQSRFLAPVDCSKIPAILFLAYFFREKKMLNMYSSIYTNITREPAIRYMSKAQIYCHLLRSYVFLNGISGRGFWAETRIWFSTLIFLFYKMLFVNILEFSCFADFFVFLNSKKSVVFFKIRQEKGQ